jgi:hypothetical protein
MREGAELNRAPYDITLEELRLETFFPADEAYVVALRALSGA